LHGGFPDLARIDSGHPDINGPTLHMRTTFRDAATFIRQHLVRCRRTVTG
jgi:hypothetical protein